MAKSEQNSAVGAEGVDASSRDPQMIGDGMVGSSSDVNQGTTAGGKRIGRGQSPRSSEEAGNDRGAKGGRDVVLAAVEHAFQKDPSSAARLNRSDAPENRACILIVCRQWTACMSGELGETLCGWCDSSQTWSRVPEPVHQQPRTGKPDAGEPPVRFGWAATERSVPYPHILRQFFLISCARRALLVRSRSARERITSGSPADHERI